MLGKYNKENGNIFPLIDPENKKLQNTDLIPKITKKTQLTSLGLGTYGKFSEEKYNNPIPITSTDTFATLFGGGTENIYNKNMNPEYAIFTLNALHKYTETQEIKIYQEGVLDSVVEDPVAFPDYSAAYKRLIKERNKPWKINPSDIADFYLLEGFLDAHEKPRAYQEDPDYLLRAKAKGRISEIGKRLLVALAHEQLDEYDRFARVKPNSVPEDLRETIHDYFDKKVEKPPLIAVPDQEVKQPREDNFENEMNAYLSLFNDMLEQHASRGETMDIFTDKDNVEMFGNALRILESQQTGRWKIMATAMRALFDKSIPMKNFVANITTTDNAVEVDDETERLLERKREPFLIDRLLNYVHNTGTVSARVTNYFPRAASLLVAHGLPGHNRYLFYHSSMNNDYTNDVLTKKVREYATQEPERDLIEDVATVIPIVGMPREYRYAMLLEFDDPRLHDVIQPAKNKITPTRAYTLLQRVSHHDGHSKGRLKSGIT